MQGSERVRCRPSALTNKVRIGGSQGKTAFARALLDSCSEANFITERVVQQLGLTRIKQLMTICGIVASSAKSTHCTVVTFSSVDSSYSHTLTFNVLQKITNEILAWAINTSCWKIPSDLRVGNPNFATPQKIDLVIGAQLFFSQLSATDDSAACQPLLQRTVLGWVVSGPVDISNEITVSWLAWLLFDLQPNFVPSQGNLNYSVTDKFSLEQA